MQDRKKKSKRESDITPSTKKGNQPPTPNQLIEIHNRINDDKEWVKLQDEMDSFSWSVRLITALSLVISALILKQQYDEGKELNLLSVESLSKEPLSTLSSMLLIMMGGVASTSFILKPIVKRLNAHANSKIKKLTQVEIEPKNQEEAEKMLEELEALNDLNKKINDQAMNRLVKELLPLATMLYISGYLTDSPALLALLGVVTWNALFAFIGMNLIEKDFTATLEQKKEYFNKILDPSLERNIKEFKGQFLKSSTIKLEIGNFNRKGKNLKSIPSLLASQLVKNTLLRLGFKIVAMKGSTIVIAGDCDIKLHSPEKVQKEITQALENYQNKQRDLTLLSKQFKSLAGLMISDCYHIPQKNAEGEMISQYYLTVPLEFRTAVNINSLKKLFDQCNVIEQDSTFIIAGKNPANETTFNSCLTQIKSIIAAQEAKKREEAAKLAAARNRVIKEAKKTKDNKKESKEEKEESKDVDVKDKPNPLPLPVAPQVQIDWGHGIVFDSKDETCRVQHITGNNAFKNFYSFFALSENDFMGDDRKLMFNKFSLFSKTPYFARHKKGDTGIKLFRNFKEATDSNGERFLASAEIKVVGDYGSTGNRRVWGEIRTARTGEQVIVWRGYSPEGHKK